eukprot:s1424_g16.t1
MHEEMEEQTSAQADQVESTTGGQSDAASSQRAAQLATALIKRLRSQAEGEKLLDRYQVEGSKVLAEFDIPNCEYSELEDAYKRCERAPVIAASTIPSWERNEEKDVDELVQRIQDRSSSTMDADDRFRHLQKKIGCKLRRGFLTQQVPPRSRLRTEHCVLGLPTFDYAFLLAPCPPDAGGPKGPPVASPVPLKATMARRPDDTRGSLIFQEGKCIEGDYYIVAVYDDPATCTISFSAYELENDCTYTYPLTYSQFDALFQYDSELMNPSNQDGRFHWVIERLDFVQDKRGQKVLCLGEEATAEVDDEADLVQEKPKATSAVPANVGGKIDGATRAKLLKELDTQDDAKLHAALVKSEGARKRFIAELHAKRNLEQLKASQRLQKADEDREARLAKLEQIKKQQHARAEAHRAAEEAKKSTMAQLEVLMKQKEAQAIRRLIQEKDAQDRGMGREKDAARQRRKMQERSAAEVRAIEEERAQQLAKKRDTEVEKRQGLILKKNRQIAEILRDEKLKDREYQVRLREEKDLIIQDVWKSKAQVRVAQEEKEREYIRLEEIREKVNVERERRRALDELKQISAIRKHAEEEKEVTVKRREKMRKEYLLQLKVEASNRAQAVREQARRNERREQKIQEREEVRLRKFRESQFMDTMRATRTFLPEGETMDADGNAERTLEAGQMSQTGMTDQAHQKTLAADERRKRQADRDEKLKREDEKKGKMAQLSGKNPNLAELERIAQWRAADEAKKQMLEDARTKRELAREQALRDMHETAAKRDELWNRLEVTRTEREEERQQNRQKASARQYAWVFFMYLEPSGLG